MTAARSYKKPMSAVAARQELTRCAGTQFDPAIVRAFLNVSIGRLRWTIGPVSWLADVPILTRLGMAGHAVAAGAQVALGAAALTVGGPWPPTLPLFPPRLSPPPGRSPPTARSPSPRPRRAPPSRPRRQARPRRRRGPRRRTAGLRGRRTTLAHHRKTKATPSARHQGHRGQHEAVHGTVPTAGPARDGPGDRARRRHGDDDRSPATAPTPPGAAHGLTAPDHGHAVGDYGPRDDRSPAHHRGPTTALSHGHHGTPDHPCPDDPAPDHPGHGTTPARTTPARTTPARHHPVLDHPARDHPVR